jgi:hypothetical protein
MKMKKGKLKMRQSLGKRGDCTSIELQGKAERDGQLPHKAVSGLPNMASKPGGTNYCNSVSFQTGHIII